MKEYDIIVVGGGAAGMLAAGAAAKSGAKVALFEKMKQTGRKIGISGKGRCNITNSAEPQEFIQHFGKNGRFLRASFAEFFSDQLLGLLEAYGIDVVLERGGRYFPQNGRALDVVKSLNDWLVRSEVNIHRSTNVQEIICEDGVVKGLIANNTTYLASKVILATGGASYPKTGSTGDGYVLLQNLGHKIVTPRPALVPLNCKREDFFAKLDGLSLKNVEAHLLVNKKRKASHFGELTFTNFGLSGPSILSLSALAVEALENNDEVAIHIDLKPALNQQKLDARLIRDLTNRHTENIEQILRGLLPRQLVPVCLRINEIAPRTAAGTFPAVLRKKLLFWLKNFVIQVESSRSFDEAIVTAGGLNLKEVNPKNMESRKIEGLYIAGELLDLHADTGGFNLQAAFSTGWLAGISAAKSLKK